MLKVKTVYKKTRTRFHPLFILELTEKSDREDFPKICDGVTYFAPLNVYQKGKGTSIYYDFFDPEQGVFELVKMFSGDKEKLLRLEKELYKESKEILNLIREDNHKKLKILYKKFYNIYHIITLAVVLGDSEDIVPIPNWLKEKSVEIRSKTDSVLHPAFGVAREWVIRSLPKDKKDYVDYLTYNEIITNNLPSDDIIQKRKEGYILHFGKLYNGESLSNYSINNKLGILVEENEEEKNFGISKIKGNSAFLGKIKGNVKLVFEYRDLEKVKKGDILVMAMTNPDIILTLKKVGAIITDEGGITCHAAIIARELKKPCIIGTKIATQVLKDGDFVEVDADSGIVKILNRN